MMLFISVMVGLLFEDSKKGKEYSLLIKKVQSQKRGLVREKGYNIHHIIPKALGGSDEEENLVKLTLFEHLQAHILLALATKSPKMFFAVRMMLNMKKLSKLSELEKLELKKLVEISKLLEQSRKSIGNCMSVQLQGNSRAQGHKLSEKSKQKILETKKKNGTLKTSQLHTKKAIEKRVKSRKGRGFWNTEKTKAKISKSISNLWKDETYKQRMKNSHKGKTKVWKEGKQFHISVEEVNVWLQRGYFKTKKESLCL